MPWIMGLFGLVGEGIKGLFGMRTEQANVVKEAIGAVTSIGTTDIRRDEAIAQVLAAEASSGNWLAVSWRPILMFLCIGIIASFWLGYIPSGLNQELPPMMAEIFDIIKIGIGGYIGGRTIEKVASSFSLAQILKEFIGKKF